MKKKFAAMADDSSLPEFRCAPSGLRRTGFKDCGKRVQGCHSERSEESLCVTMRGNGEILRRSAPQNDKRKAFFRSLFNPSAFLRKEPRSKRTSGLVLLNSPNDHREDGAARLCGRACRHQICGECGGVSSRNNHCACDRGKVRAANISTRPALLQDA